MWKLKVESFWIFFFLAGCTISLPRDQQVENVSPPIPLEASRKASLATPFFAEGDWPSAHWWEGFHSPQLNALIIDALAGNPSLREAESRIQQAQQTAIIARSRLFPYIFLKGDHDWQHLSKQGLYRALNPTIPINANLIDLTLSLSYDLDFWGKNKNLFMASLGYEKAREAEWAQAELILTTSVAQAYFALKTNLLRKRLYEALYEVRQKTFELQNKVQKSALSSKLPTLFSNETVLEAKKQVLKIQEEIETDQHLINILVGVSPDEPLDIDDYLPPLAEKLVLPCDLSLELLSKRPDLMAQIWRVSALAHEVGAAIADFFPDVNLTAFLGLESTSYSFLLQASSLTAGVRPAFSLPIFTAGAIAARAGEKKAEFDAAVFAYNDLILKSVQEVADILSFARSVFQQQKEQEGIVKSAKERYDLTVLRKQKGLDSLFENYALQVNLIGRELEEVSLIYGQYVAAVKLIKAMGGGYGAECLPLKAERDL